MSSDDDAGRKAGWTAHGLVSPAFLVCAFLAYSAAFPEGPRLLLALASLLVGGFVSILVHETGHAAAALACRWRVIVFAVRPVGFHFPNRNLAMIAPGYAKDAGGWVTAVPGSAAVDTAGRWTTILAAGPLTSLMLAAAAAVAWAVEAPPVAGREPELRYLLLGLSLQCLHDAIVALLPARSPDMSDGDQLQAFRKANRGDDGSRPLHWLETLLASNVRLSRLPEWMVEEARARCGSSEAVSRYVAMIEIGRLLDSAPVDSARARQLIEAYRARHGADGWLAACDAYLAAVWELDAERARTALLGRPIREDLRHLRLAAEAAVAARSGDAPLARSRLEAMQEAMRGLSPFRDLTFRDIRRQVEAVLEEEGRRSISLPG